MKLLLVTLLFSVAAIAAETKTETTATTTEPTTPKQVCEALAKAAAADDYKSFSEWTATTPCMMGDCGKSCPMMGHDAKDCTKKNCPMHKKGKGQAKAATCPHHMHGMAGGEEGFHKMHEKELARLKDLTCKEEKVAGDHAWVEAVSQQETRLVPFKLQDGKWKFDMHAYHAFYHQIQEKAK